MVMSNLARECNLSGAGSRFDFSGHALEPSPEHQSTTRVFARPYGIQWQNLQSRRTMLHSSIPKLSQLVLHFQSSTNGGRPAIRF